MTTQPPAGEDAETCIRCNTVPRTGRLLCDFCRQDEFDDPRDTITSLRAELAEVRVDAERYRWLRANQGGDCEVVLMDDNEDGGSGAAYSYSDDALNAAIDAAIAKGKK